MFRTLRDGKRRIDEIWRGLGGQPDWLRVSMALVLGIVLLVPVLIIAVAIAVVGLIVISVLWVWTRLRALVMGERAPWRNRDDGRENVRVIRR